MRKIKIRMYLRSVLIIAVGAFGMSTAVAYDEPKDEVIVMPHGGCPMEPCPIDQLNW